MVDNPDARVLADVLTPSLLRAAASFADHERLCRLAVRHGIAAVAVTPAQVGLCAYRLAGTPVRVGTVVAFPLGQSSIAAKVWETDHVLAHGATEVGYVVNLTELREGNRGYVATEMQHVVDACRAGGAAAKVIVEASLLSDAQVREVCDIATDIGPDLLVTATGCAPADRPARTVELMRHHTGPGIGIEAACDIVTPAQARMLLDCGAARLLSATWPALLADDSTVPTS
ncbi:deoxyribose-phosphate aldolase [Propionicicella superfundia]|uniref:deoxyribose-phosphate aldolase n=1 Tax=Propionicicella superfundia TaxID=348582 RepID=UPI000406349C|nr:deoxyribose-phosphate aldolase [Propionicicella superfundia]